jgi:hypothetical protein
MRHLLIGLLLLCCVPAVGLAQNNKPKLAAEARKKIKLYEDTLGLMAFLIMNDSLPESRFASTRKFIVTLKQALKTTNSFAYKFSRLQTVSIQYPPDSTFRIFSWQLFVNDSTYHYYGAIQMNTPELKFYPLIDRSAKVEDVQQAVLSPENWYGVIYYNIRPLITPQGTKYLLFGLDTYSFFRRRKLIDVLSFQGDKLVFGAPVFPKTINNDGPVNRFLLEYSASNSVRLNWDESMNMVVFDHLIPMQGRHKEGMVMVGDGSYEAFKIQNGALVYQEKLETQVMDEPPLPTQAKGSNDMGGKRPKKN